MTASLRTPATGIFIAVRGGGGRGAGVQRIMGKRAASCVHLRRQSRAPMVANPRTNKGAGCKRCTWAGKVPGAGRTRGGKAVHLWWQARAPKRGRVASSARPRWQSRAPFAANPHTKQGRVGGGARTWVRTIRRQAARTRGGKAVHMWLGKYVASCVHPLWQSRAPLVAKHPCWRCTWLGKAPRGWTIRRQVVHNRGGKAMRMWLGKHVWQVA